MSGMKVAQLGQTAKSDNAKTMASKNNSDEKQQRADRLSQALRDNLFKRKAQARKRSSNASDKDKPVTSNKDES